MGTLLEGKRALVTGAATGIGQAIVMAYVREGAIVAAHARSEARIKPLIAAAGKEAQRIIPVAADLENDSEIRKLAEQTLAMLGGLDILVNNAGYSEKAPLAGTSDAMWDRTMQINLKAPFLLCRELVPAMKKNPGGGRIIFNSSIAAKLPDPGGSAYNSAKAGVLGLMRCLAAELGQFGITVNAICPGWVDTPMARTLHEDMFSGDAHKFDEFFQSSTSGNMLQQQIKPEDIADFAVFLASDQAKRITSQAINVCAGLCLS